jgi:hypothetical protein
MSIMIGVVFVTIIVVDHFDRSFLLAKKGDHAFWLVN